MTHVPFRRSVRGTPKRARLAENLRQKAGPGLPLHLPILYRKRNSNPSRCSPFALASGLKGFMHTGFGSFFGIFRIDRTDGL
jgi:hypothetical protein